MQLKKTILFLTLQLFFQIAFASSDTLLVEFRSEENPRRRIQIAYEYARINLFKQPEKAKEILQIAIKDSTGFSDFDSLAFCYNGLGVYFFNNSDFDSCIYYAEKAIEVLSNTKNLEKINMPRKNIALARRSLGQYNLALDEFFIILESYKKSEDSARIAGMLNDIGNTYYYLGDYEKGINYQNETPPSFKEYSQAIKNTFGKKQMKIILASKSGVRKKILDEKDVSMANPEDVKKITGYTIGGVSPTGHLTKIKIFIDETLNRFSSIFAAAGHPNAVFEINFENLIALTSGEIKEITE